MKIYLDPPVIKPTTPLLDQVKGPADLKGLDISELKALSDELRGFLLWTVARTGGHLGASLGVVELTVALHHLLNLPQDNLIWDVGHQIYPHKILTGRKDQMDKIRQQGGIKGFPSRFESEYDDFGAGHSSTSISAALGMSIAAEILGKTKKTVAVIGDGAMTAGMAFEALCHGSEANRDVLVILNDNSMSISPNSGGLHNHLSQLRTGHLDDKLPTGGVFSDLGWNYTGPIDGHDIDALVSAIELKLNEKGPGLLHVLTRKGAGWQEAENHPLKHHAISSLNPIPKESKSEKKAISVKLEEKPLPKYQDIFGKWIIEKAKQDKRLVGITPAMGEGSGLVEFSHAFPARYFDVAIAEQHAVTFAAGLACEGAKPVVSIYSTFLQRAYDQLIHDVALQKLDVTFAIDRAGVVGEDGPTHTGAYDIAFMLPIADLIVVAPSDEKETISLLDFCYEHPGPAAIRFPRGKVIQTIESEEKQANKSIKMGKARKIRTGNQNYLILSFGPLLPIALQVANQIEASVYDMRFCKPYDSEMILAETDANTVVIILEDGVGYRYGVSSAIAAELAKENKGCRVLPFGINDTWVDQGSREQILQSQGLEADAILKAVADAVAPSSSS